MFLVGSGPLAKAKTERQRSSIALQAGGSPGRNIKKSVSDKALELSCSLVKVRAVTSDRLIHMQDRTRASITLRAYEREDKDGAATLTYSPDGC